MTNDDLLYFQTGPKKIYLATPYSHPDSAVRDVRAAQVTDVAAKVMLQGHLIFSTITYTHDMSKQYDMPTNFEWWLAFNNSFIDWADTVMVLCLDGWEVSRGVTAEIQYAAERNKRVVYVSLEDFI